MLVVKCGADVTAAEVLIVLLRGVTGTLFYIILVGGCFRFALEANFDFFIQVFGASTFQRT